MSGQFSLHKKRRNKTNAISFIENMLFFSKNRWFQPGLRVARNWKFLG